MTASREPRRALSKSSDYLNSLATTLRDLGGATTIPHELTQNADDAGNATTIRFAFHNEALVVWNDGTFTDCKQDTDACAGVKRCDLHAFRTFAGQTKSNDNATTGAFGVGFTSVYQVTDAPELLYDDEHWILDEAAPEHERIRACDGGCGRLHGESGTTFVLPWARTMSELRTKLQVAPVSDDDIRNVVAAIRSDACATLLFLRHVHTLEVQSSLGTYRAERATSGDRVTIRDETGEQDWLTLSADLGEVAHSLVSRYPGLIKHGRPTAVTIAVPLSSDFAPGSLYATLPTQTPSGLPAHVNGSSYPATSRKSVAFETGHASEWNRAVMSAATTCLAESVDTLFDALSVERFWKFLGAVTDLSLHSTTSGLGHGHDFLAALGPAVQIRAVLPIVGGTMIAPKEALLPAQEVLYEASEAFAAIELPVARKDLHKRLFTNSVYTKFGVRSLRAVDVTMRLASSGFNSAFDPMVGRLGLEQVRSILTMFAQLPTKLENVDGLREVAIIPCRNGLVAPPSSVLWPTDESEAALFELLVPDLLIADTSWLTEHCPGIQQLCRALDVEFASTLLAKADSAGLDALNSDLMDWLQRRTAALDEGTRARLADLPLFRSSSGTLEPLTALSLPTDFTDPIGVAAIVDPEVARDFHRLLGELRAQPLDIADYFSRHAVPAATEGRISVDQATELLRTVALSEDALLGLRDELAASPIVPCTDGQLRPASDCHQQGNRLQVLAPELPVASPSLSRSALEWLGVPSQPTDRALSSAIERLIDGEEDRDNSIAEAVVLTLEDRRVVGDETIPAFAISKVWLPVATGGRAKPSDVLPTNQRYLFGRQAKEFGLKAPFQARHFDLLVALGMPRTPPASVVVVRPRHVEALTLPLTSGVLTAHLSGEIGLYPMLDGRPTPVASCRLRRPCGDARRA